MSSATSSSALDTPYISVKPTRVSAFCQWLADTSGSIALHESLYMYPLVESTHVLTLCLFVGMAMMLDLRLTGPHAAAGADVGGRGAAPAVDDASASW